MGGSQSQAKEWEALSGLWAGCLATGRVQGGPRGSSWGLPAFPQETLSVFSAMLHGAAWAASLDANAEAACGPMQREEELSLSFLIRDSSASGKSSTGWLWFAHRHWVAKQDMWLDPHFSFCLQSVSFRVKVWSHKNLQCWSWLTGQSKWVADAWGLVASHVFSGFLSKTLVTLSYLKNACNTVYPSKAWDLTADLLLSGEYLQNTKCVSHAALHNQSQTFRLKHTVPSTLQLSCQSQEVIFHPAQHNKHPWLSLMLNCSQR